MIVPMTCNVKKLKKICDAKRQSELNQWRNLISYQLETYAKTYSDLSGSTGISIDRLQSIITKVFPHDYEAIAINRAMMGYHIAHSVIAAICEPSENICIPGEVKLLNDDLREKL